VAAAPAPKRKRTGRPRKRVEPVEVASADNQPKTVMQRIFESQRAELENVNEELTKKVIG